MANFTTDDRPIRIFTFTWESCLATRSSRSIISGSKRTEMGCSRATPVDLRGVDLGAATLRSAVDRESCTVNDSIP